MIITDLYSQCVEERLNEQLNKIHKYFLCLDNSVNLQNKLINPYLNYSTYQQHRNDLIFKEQVNELFCTLKDYIDASVEEFISSFSGNYVQKVFELVIGNFIKNNGVYFDSRKKTCTASKKTKRSVEAQPDWIFKKNGKTYYLECTTRNTSQIDKFYKFVPFLEKYLEVAEIYFTKCLELADQEQNLWDALIWCCEPYLEYIPDYFTECQKTKILNNLEVTDLSKAILKFKEWVYYTRYVVAYFRDLIPTEIIEKLERYKFYECGFSQNTEQVIENKKFLLNSVTQLICDKLKKKYSQKGVPIILTVSLANFRDQLISPIGHLHFSSKMAEDLLKNIVGKLSKNKQISINNLYAIILDTTWYNWFPEMAIANYGAQFPQNYKNCFCIIYNQGLILEHGKLFEEAIPYQAFFNPRNYTTN